MRFLVFMTLALAVSARRFWNDEAGEKPKLIAKRKMTPRSLQSWSPFGSFLEPPHLHQVFMFPSNLVQPPFSGDSLFRTHQFSFMPSFGDSLLPPFQDNLKYRPIAFAEPTPTFYQPVPQQTYNPIRQQSFQFTGDGDPKRNSYSFESASSIFYQDGLGPSLSVKKAPAIKLDVSQPKAPVEQTRPSDWFPEYSADESGSPFGSFQTRPQVALPGFLREKVSTSTKTKRPVATLTCAGIKFTITDRSTAEHLSCCGYTVYDWRQQQCVDNKLASWSERSLDIK